MKNQKEPASSRSHDNADGTPVSVKIRERLLAARKRFHANDNIAEFIEPGELETLLDEVEASDDPALKVRRKRDPGPLFPWDAVLAVVPLRRLG